MSGRFWRSGGVWCAGWIWGDFWLTLSGGSRMVCLDVGRWRIRWTRPGFRPLFSERYGYEKWHKVGRLGAHHHQRRTIA